jgi:hypothetical protein
VDGVVNEVLYNATGSVPGLYSTSPWSSTDPISLTSLVTSTSKTSATNLRFVVPATGKAVTATTPDTLIFSGESVKIYYTPVDSGVELTQYTSSVTFTYANFTNDSDSTVRQKDITLSGENEFRSYSFKAFLVTESGKEIPLQ